MSFEYTTSIGDAASAMSQALSRELRVEQGSRFVMDILRLVGQDWMSRPKGLRPPFHTDITDDGTPFELSVAFEGMRPELRVLAEAQCHPYTLQSNWDEGMRVTEALAEKYQLDVGKLVAVSDLFAPSEGTCGEFAIWHAAALRRRGPPLIKVYLNPQAKGRGTERATVREAMCRLDLRDSWDFLQSKLEVERGATIAFFSLDLCANPRVKVYLAYPSAVAKTLEAAMAGTSEYRKGDATAFIDEVAGQSGPFDKRPPLVCHSFSSGSDQSSATLHVPVRCYVEHDGDAVARCRALLPSAHADRFQRAVEAMAGRSLDLRPGIVTYASYRRHRGNRRVTFYLAPELYTSSRVEEPMSQPVHSYIASTSARGRSDAGPTMITVQDAIRRYQAELREHPFLRRLADGASLSELRSMTKGLTFYVMSFQDVLRLARMTIKDPVMSQLAQTHEKEDRGHDQWFLYDASRLKSSCDLRAVFSDDHATTRDVSYALVSQILSATDDRQRLAVVLSLEAAGAEFFCRVIRVLERLGKHDGMRYFARSHQAVEEGHQVFEEDSQHELLSIPVPRDVLAQVLTSVENTFAAMTRLADELERLMAGARRNCAVA